MCFLDHILKISGLRLENMSEDIQSNRPYSCSVITLFYFNYVELLNFFIANIFFIIYDVCSISYVHPNIKHLFSFLGWITKTFETFETASLQTVGPHLINIDYYMAFFMSYPLSAQEPIGMIYKWGLIKGMKWKVTCYDVFIIYFNRGNNWFVDVPKCSVIFV
jgi:hypothetical protein